MHGGIPTGGSTARSARVGGGGGSVAGNRDVQIFGVERLQNGFRQLVVLLELLDDDVGIARAQYRVVTAVLKRPTLGRLTWRKYESNLREAVLMNVNRQRDLEAERQVKRLEGRQVKETD